MRPLLSPLRDGSKSARWALAILLTFGANFAQGAEVIKIGVAGPMSGELAKMGHNIRTGVEMAIAEWNATGGVLGSKIELLVGDDQLDPLQAKRVAQKMVKEGVWGIIGHLNSSSSISASTVYNEAGIPQITPSSTDPRLTEQGLDNVFRTCGRDDQQAAVAADFIYNHLKARRVAVIHDKTPYGQGLGEAFKRAVSKRGKGLVVAYEGITQGEQDHTAVLKKIKTTRPQAIYFGGIYPDGGLVLRQARELGIKAFFVSGDGVIDPEFVKIAGEEAALGSYLTFSPDPALVPSASAFIEKYKKKYGGLGPYSISAYDATNVLLHAIQLAKPKDNTKGELIKVSKAIHAMTHEGTLGRLRWDRKGDLVDSPYVVYITKKGGRFEGWFEQITDFPPGPRPPAKGIKGTFKK